MLSVGDKIQATIGFYRPRFCEACIQRIELVKVGEAYGEEVSQVDESLIGTDLFVVDLDNGHWVYGSQVKKKIV